MARYLHSNGHRFVAVLSENATLVINRRWYAVSSREAAPSEEKMVVTSKKKKKNTTIEGLVDSSSSSWVPDPVTGYYRPANRVGEADPAELRKTLLSK